jgi:L-2-hydroxyglutarate oxidase LhgO
MLYEYCRSHQVGTQQYGKLIVAADDSQLDDLRALQHRAQENDVPGISMISGKEAVALEPQLQCTAAIHSKSTGIVDSHGYMLSLLGGFEDAGGMVAYQSPLLRATALTGGGFRLEIGDKRPCKLRPHS